MSSNKSMDQLYTGVAFSSKAFSGVDPDSKHLSQGGYHVPRDKCPYGDYSAGGPGRNTSARDKGGSGSISCAIDIRFSTADMITVTKRLLAAMGTNALRGVREFNGTADGRTTLNRDAVLGWKQNYVPDATHLWHVHIGFFRDTADDWRVISDVLSVINGVNTSSESTETVVVTPEDDMAAVPQNEWNQAKADIAKAASDASRAFALAAEGNRAFQASMGYRPLHPGEKLLPGVTAPKFKDSLGVDERLYTGDVLWSANGNNRVGVQTDGNIVLYDYADTALWSTVTTNATTLIVQTDGNVVAYTGDGKAVWSAGTNSATRLVIQDDGNFVAYDVTGKPVWSSLTRR